MKFVSKVTHFFLYFLALSLPFLASCSDSKENEPTIQFSVPAEILANGLKFDQNSGESTFNVQSSEVITVSSSEPSWCTVTKGQRNDKSMTPVTVKVDENTSTESRSAKISIYSGSQAKTVNVVQDAKASVPTPTPVEGKTAMEVAKEMGAGWNLGNHFDGTIENQPGKYWDNATPTQALYDKLKENGFKTVRIPVTWMHNMGGAPEYKLKPEYLAEVRANVEMAEKAGLYVIINIHHDGANGQYWLKIKEAANDAKVNAVVKENITAVWSQIADYFADKGQFLIFESFNEIQDGGWGWGDNRKDGGKQYRTLNDWNQTFVDVVRSKGGNNASRILGIPSYSTSPELSLEDSFVLPNDPVKDRMMVSVHYYAPTNYTLEAKFTEWGHTGAPGKKETWGDEDAVRDIFGKLKSKFVDANIPVYIGETGNVNRDDERADSFRRYYLEYIFKAAKEYGLVPVLWDNNVASYGRECHGTFDHNDGKFVNKYAEAVVKTITNAVNNNDASYTLRSVYDNAPK